MTGRDSVRLLWNQGNDSQKSIETLDTFQRRMELLCAKRRIKPYEQKMFDEGWMYIEWTRFKPVWNRKLKIESLTPFAQQIYTELQSESHQYNFDAQSRIWSGERLVKSLKELTLQLNPKMASFLHQFRGDCLLMDKMSDNSYPGNPTPDWDINTGDITWFLKRPNY